jgi:hypothetical protein
MYHCACGRTAYLLRIGLISANLTSDMKWWDRLGIGDHPHEPDDLERLIAEKLRETGIIARAADPHDEHPKNAPLDPYTAFLRYRFAAQLRNYRRWGGPYAFIFIVFSLGVIVFGLASSGIAAGWDQAHWARWSILVLGVLIGGVTAINQLWKPGEKGVGRTRGAHLLCREGWDFIHDRGRYKEIDDPREAWGTFVDQVERVSSEVTAVDETEPKPLATPKGRDA